MTLSRPLATTLAVVLLAALGATAALGSPAASRAGAPASVVVVVQTPATDQAGIPFDAPAAPGGRAFATPEPVRLAAARAAAQRVAPGVRPTVRVVTGATEARAAITRAAATSDVVVAAGPDVAGALTAARAEWPGVRAVAAG